VTARSSLAELITKDVPDEWLVLPYPDALRTFEASQPVAVVIESTNVAVGETSPDGDSIPLVWTLTVWIVVDGSRGDTVDVIEDRLDDALETVIRCLSALPAHVWDGTADRTAYDTQKPAYRLTITAHGTITQGD